MPDIPTERQTEGLTSEDPPQCPTGHNVGPLGPLPNKPMKSVTIKRRLSIRQMEGRREVENLIGGIKVRWGQMLRSSYSITCKEQFLLNHPFTK